MAPDESMLDQALAHYQRQRERSAELYQQMREVTETVTAPRQVVKVTVGPNGVTDLSFPSHAYKNMPGTELASVILKTIGQAQQRMQARSAELLAPTLPAGVSAEDLMNGNVDLAALLPERPRRSEFSGRFLTDEGGRA